MLLAYGIKSVVTEVKDEGIVQTYEDGNTTFLEWETLEYRFKIGDTCIIRN